MDYSTTHEKLTLELKQDNEGWPPVSVETVWIKKLSDGRYMVDSIPFYSSEVALGDIVGVKPSVDGTNQLINVITPSGASTLHVLAGSQKALDESILPLLNGLGLKVERANERYAAVSVPVESSYKMIREKLDDMSSKGLLTYQESLLRHKI